MDTFKCGLGFMNEASRNVFKFLPFIGPKIFNGKTRIDNKIVIITGGNNGIGKETARELAARGAKVIIGCRNVERGQNAAEELNNDERVKGNGKVIFKQLDLASFESIRKFADEINNEEEVIDILVNNAGLAMTVQQKTQDGFEIQFGVNHLGHFLLTLLLLDKLKQSKSIARIINVSSAIYFQGEINFDDINFEKTKYDATKAYAQSKLANVLFTRELAKRIKGTNIRVYALHPGFVKTNIQQNADQEIIKNFEKFMFMAIPSEIGCQTTLYCALDEKLANESGHYYANCTKCTNSSFAVSSYLASKALDDETAEKLWDLSFELVKLEDKYKIDKPNVPK